MVDARFVEELLDNYVYQKVALLERAGHRGTPNTDRMRTFARPKIEQMAVLTADWFVSPDILMEAVFDWAVYKRHPDGPMPNMLASEKYITQALSHYLQVPMAVVADKKCQSLFMERRDFEFDRIREELAKIGVTNLVTAASYPIEVRYVMAARKLDFRSMFLMAQDLLARMKSDRRVASWLNHRGFKYELIASHFNKMRKKYER